jgi:hypothetical protein
MPKVDEGRYMVQAGWDDVPHLTEQAKAELLASIPPHMRDARTQGTPSLGAGAIYPIPISEIECEPFMIPEFWKKAYGFDVGWNRTAAVWGAEDPLTGIIYLYAEHYRGQERPTIHADAIKARGAWMQGAIDPASRGRDQKDGEQLMAVYKEKGLKLKPADNSVESGIYRVWMLLGAGRLKIFRTLMNWKSEYRLYRRDEKGKIVKENDHLMDSSRYLINTWAKVASQRPMAENLTVASKGITGDTGAGY